MAKNHSAYFNMTRMAHKVANDDILCTHLLGASREVTQGADLSTFTTFADFQEGVASMASKTARKPYGGARSDADVLSVFFSTYPVEA